MKDVSVQAKTQVKRSIVVRLFREHVVLQNGKKSLTNYISPFPERWRKTISTEYHRQLLIFSKPKKQ